MIPWLLILYASFEAYPDSLYCFLRYEEQANHAKYNLVQLADSEQIPGNLNRQYKNLLNPDLRFYLQVPW